MRTILKRIGLALAGLIGILIAAAAVMYFVGSSKLNAAVNVPPEPFTLATDSSTIAWGYYLAHTQGCADCHGTDLSGKVMIDAPPFRIVATNLTAGVGGIAADYHDVDWERAIRHGVGPDGTGLAPMMPSKAYHGLSDDETMALVAYLKSIPAVDNDLPATTFRPLGRFIAATGGLSTADTEIEHRDPHPVTAPSHGATIDYGAYRVNTLCAYCHGDDLHGGDPLEPNTPAPPDLYGTSVWTLDQFVHAMRTGTKPSGVVMDAEYMPWTTFANMSDEELEAIHLYLSTLTPAGADSN